MFVKPLSLNEIAALVGGKVIGDGAIVVNNIKPLEEAGVHEISFFAPTSKRASAALLAAARNTKASALLLSEEDSLISSAQIVVKNPMQAVIQLTSTYSQKPKTLSGISPLASVSPTASLGENVAVGAFSFIGDNVVVGPNTVIHPHVVIYDGAAIGANCVLHAGAVIREYVEIADDCLIQNGAVVGADGFGYIPDKVLGQRRLPHVGTVRLESRVDLGANTTVDRAQLGTTKIGAASKLDNLVMVGHNVTIGERAILCAQVGVSGSTQIGDDTVIGGNAGLADHLKIGKQVRIAAKSGVVGHVDDNSEVAGYPHAESSLWRRAMVLVRQLPELFQKVQLLNKRIESLEKELPAGRLPDISREAKRRDKTIDL